MIKYRPDKLIAKIAPESKIKKMIKGNVTLKKSALTFISEIDFIDKKKVTEVALKTVNSYQERIAKVQADAGEKAAGKDLTKELTKDPRQLIQRVQNEVVYQISNEIKSKYSGKEYVWLPSDADEPDPEHQLNYGKVFVIGQGEQPGERYGCRCGMEILTDETKLEL